MNQNNNHFLTSPSSNSPKTTSAFQMQSQLAPYKNNSLHNSLHSNINKNSLNKLQDPSQQYPYYYYPYASLGQRNQFDLQYNRSEQTFSLQPELDLELKRQVSDSFLYLYAPFMNIDYIPLSSSSASSLNSNSNPHKHQYLEKKRLRETKSNNSPLSTDIDNTNNPQGMVLYNKKNKDKAVYEHNHNDILDIEPIKEIAPSIQEAKANIKESSVTDGTTSEKGLIVPITSPIKEKALPKPIISGNNIRKRNDHPLKEIDLYTDKEYNDDLDLLMKSSTKHKFMKEHFSNAYTKTAVLNNIKKVNEKRRLKTIFLEPNSLKEKAIFISNPMRYECNNIKVPSKIWSPPNDMKDNDYSTFYYKLEQKWPFNKCPCVIEHILEYLMINGYSQDNCLREFNDCVKFVNDKVATSLVEDHSEKKDILRSQRKKQYNLRDRKVNK